MSERYDPRRHLGQEVPRPVPLGDGSFRSGGGGKGDSGGFGGWVYPHQHRGFVGV